jgi:hypothetical protein
MESAHTRPAHESGHPDGGLLLIRAIPCQGDSYRLRAYVGELAGRPARVQPDAPTTDEFLRLYSPQFQVGVAPEQLSVDHADRWATIIATHDERLCLRRRSSS